MKSPEDQKDALTKLNTYELEILQGVINQLEQVIKSPNLKEETLQTLENSCRELLVLKWTYTKKVLRLLKRGYVPD